MITGAYLLLVMGAILYLCGWVMLLVLGFKKGLGWGLVMLFLSWLVIPLIVFLIKFWDEAKTGFLIMVAGVVLSGLGGFILVGSVATSAIAEVETFDVTRLEPVNLPPEEPQEQTFEDSSPAAEIEDDGTETEIEPEPESIEIGAPEDDLDTDPAPLAGTVLGEKVEWQPLGDLSTLGGYVDELIELRLTDGTQVRVTLEAIEGSVLRVHHRVGGGAMTYQVKMDQIDEIYVMK